MLTETQELLYSIVPSLDESGKVAIGFEIFLKIEIFSFFANSIIISSFHNLRIPQPPYG
jgi:hypothetical protein